MNKVFKVIWSEARNAYVVVSEIAKNMGSKSCSTKKLLAMLIATGVMTCAGMAPAMAANLAPNDTLIAIGHGAEATAKNAIAIGYGAKANVINAETSENATTNEQAVDPANAIAIGYQAEATNANAAAIGFHAQASGENAVALGNTAMATDKNSIALGNTAQAIAENATALGNTAHAHGVNSTALGTSAEAVGTQATAVGYKSVAFALESTAIGFDSSATITDSVALGSNSVANRKVNEKGYLAPDNSDSDLTWKADLGAVSVGSNTDEHPHTRQIMNVAAGTYDTDAVNVAQLRVVNEAAKAAKTVINQGDNVTITSTTDTEDGHTIYTINATDTDTTYTAGNGIKIDSGDGNKISVKLKEGEQNLSFDEDGNLSLNITQAVVYKDNDPNKAIMSTNAGEVADNAAIALGKGAIASDRNAIALGTAAEVTDSDSIAIGTKAKVTGNELSSGIAIGKEAAVSGENAIVIGTSASVSGEDAVAVGVSSYADGKKSTALGASASAWKEGAIAVGAATAYGERSTALGYGSYTNANDSVALGSDSYADREAGSVVGYLSPQDEYSADDQYKPEVAVWKANRGAVSVGYKGQDGGQDFQYTRQITNVAAGSDLTDAVNVAQLKVVKAEADKHTTLQDGKNTKVEKVDTEDGHLAYKVNVQGALTDITSITNGSSTITLNNGNVVVNNKVTINSDGKISGVANGTADNDAVNVSQLNALKSKQAVVYVNDNKNNALKSTNASSVAANAAIGLGNRVYSTGENAIAIGGSDKVGDNGYSVTEAAGSHSIAIGISAWTPGDYATAVGNNAHAETRGSVAIGAGSVAKRTAGEWVGLYAPTGTESATWKANLGDASVGYHYTDKQGVTHYFTRQITHVAAGTEDTDAVNVAQLKIAKTEVVKGNDNVTVEKTKGADGQDIYTIKTKDTTYTAGDNVTIDANNKISATDTKYTAGNGISIDSTNNNAISVKLKEGEQNLVVNADGLSLNQNLNVTSVNAGGTVINNGGLSIGGNTYVSASGLNANGQKITNVANGTDDSDAVNYGQLKAIETTAGKGWNVSTNGGTATKVAPGDTVDFAGDDNISVSNEGKNVKVALKGDISVNSVTTNNAYVTNVDASKNSSVTNVEYVNQKTAAAKTEVKAGTNVASVKETTAADGHTVYTVNAKDTTVSSSDSNISATAEVNADTNVTNYKLQLASDLTGITSISNNNGASIKLSNGNVVVNNKVTINSDGKISGVAEGDISENSKDAVNGSQLYKVQQEAGKHSKVVEGTNTNVEATNQDDQMVYKVNLNSDILLKDLTSETGKYVSISGTKGTIETTGSITTKDRVYAENGGKLANIDVTGNKISNGSSSITMDGSNVKVNDKVTIDQTGKISGVANGIEDNDAVNVSQLKETNNRVTNVENRVTNVEGYITEIKGDIKNINTTLKDHTTQINQNAQNITNLDNRVTEVEKTAGKHSSVSTEDSNIIIDKGTNAAGGTDYKLSLNKNQVLDSVTTGDTVMNNDGIKVGDKVSVTKDAVTAGNTSISNDGLKVGDKTYVNSDGLNANSQKVTNVADGEISATSKDAVNGSQLHAASEQIIDNSNRISRLGNRINKVGAGAAALAALHPMDFDPDDKWSFAAGYGNYAGENAAAIGAYYRPDEKVMFSVGGTVGNGENMVNAGISFALDRTNHVSNSRTALAREVIDLRSQLVEMGAKMAKMEAMLGVIDESKTKLFPDVPANHWAYEYIAKLAGNGILEGYPDGTFGGDRLMTRYEFATMLYRAIEKGAALEERIINEFAPELGRIRVDRISGKDSDRNKIERVRVNGPRSERDHYGSKLK